MDETLALVLVGAVRDDQLGHEQADQGVAAEGAHVRPDDAEHLADEGLDEVVEAAELPQPRRLPDEEQVEVAQVLLDPGAGDVGQRGQVHAGAEAVTTHRIHLKRGKI